MSSARKEIAESFENFKDQTVLTLEKQFKHLMQRKEELLIAESFGPKDLENINAELSMLQEKIALAKKMEIEIKTEPNFSVKC